MVNTPGAASISTSSASPATSSSGLARRIPLELPILTSFARTTTTPARRAHIVATLAATAHPLLWLTLAITSPQRGKGETRSSWWRVWCMALFCGQSVIAAGRIYREIQQKTENAACERFLDLTMPGHRLRDACRWISIPIVFTSMAYQDASTLLDRPDQISPLHGMTNSPTLRAPGICPPERSR